MHRIRTKLSYQARFVFDVVRQRFSLTRCIIRMGYNPGLTSLEDKRGSYIPNFSRNIINFNIGRWAFIYECGIAPESYGEVDVDIPSDSDRQNANGNPHLTYIT